MNLWVSSVLILSLFSSVVAAAEPADAVPEEAAAHFKKGSNAYRAGDLDEAVTELKAAVKLKPTPNGIFALGQALREKGELAAAAHEYRQYLVLAPNGPFAEKSTSFLASIEATLASERKTQTAPPQGVPAEATAQTPESPPPTQTTVEPTPVAVIDVSPKTKPPIYKRWWLWTAVGVVVVAGVAVGVALGTESHLRSSATNVTF